MRDSARGVVSTGGPDRVTCVADSYAKRENRAIAKVTAPWDAEA